MSGDEGFEERAHLFAQEPGEAADVDASSEAAALEEAAPPEFASQPIQSAPQPRFSGPGRIPNFGHLCILGLPAFFAVLAATLLTRSALYFHLFGIANSKQAMADIRYTLGSQGLIYIFMLGGCLLLYPPLWDRGFFDGLAWNGATALRLRNRLLGAAFACFVLALVNGMLMPTQKDAPIDKIMKVAGTPWLMFAFGVTFAPFFEELFFRGFLLPALCTAADWVTEKVKKEPPRPLAADGHAQWSLAAMVIGSICTSVPFAAMHAEQTGHAVGPFVMLVAVSLVLCWTRLASRSLAASVVVHACYNFLLFTLMLVGTGGFRHLEKL